MRYVITTLFALIVSVIASASCMTNSIFLLSKKTSLNKNGIIILEFYALSQAIIPKLNDKYPIYLQSKREKIILSPIEILEGEFRVTQVVLKASAALSANETYELYIDNLPKHLLPPQKYDEQLGTLESIRFTISAIEDNKIPLLTSPPSEGKKTMVSYGCGPAEWVYFKIAAEDQSELFVRAAVKNDRTGKITEYILAIENGSVKIGHGMCSGGFSFEGSFNYQVSFTLFDQSGNKSETTTSFAFSRPTISTNEE